MNLTWLHCPNQLWKLWKTLCPMMQVKICLVRNTGGSTVTAKRTKLDPTNVNMLVYLRENMNKIKIDKLVLENQTEEANEKEFNVDN